jgi:hypothetical protein
MVSMSSGLVALRFELLGRVHGHVKALAVRHDGHVASLPRHPSRPDGDGVIGLLTHVALQAVHQFTLQKEDRIVVPDGRLEQALPVVGDRGGHDLQAGEV